MNEVPVGWTSVHPAVEEVDVGAAAGAAAGVGAGVPGHLPQVVWQKLPASMKGALHLPNPFCRHHKQGEPDLLAGMPLHICMFSSLTQMHVV